MSNVTVKQLAEVVGTPVEKLLEQMKDAGVELTSAEQEVSDEQKRTLLSHLRQSHGKSDSASSGKKISLKKRKSVSEIKVAGRGAASKTVSVETRKKRTFVKGGAAKVAAEATTSAVAEAPVSKMAELTKKVEEENRALNEKRRENQQAEQLEKEEKQRKVAEEKAKLEDEEKKKTEAREAKEARFAAEDAAKDAPKKEATEAKPKAKKKAAKGDATRYGRNELHVGGGAGAGRRKPKRRRNPVVNAPTKHGFEKPTEPVARELQLGEMITVGDMAQQLSIKTSEVIKALMGMGVMATINQ
ncbi:MAG TPA: translation initiation factor IF-2, partial [Gammaproteobacteria bacterium]|nr:translation initiation factor IF-2 [Gammaproteobacteria bacterium]